RQGRQEEQGAGALHLRVRKARRQMADHQPPQLGDAGSGCAQARQGQV
ncbi:hypothetical protein XPN_0710, partial [Xanthomonas arboricola pv. pruni MAFF 301427]